MESLSQNPLFIDFRLALANGDGYGVAATLTPIAPAHDAGRLHSFHRDSNHYSVMPDVRSAVLYHSDTRLTKNETNAWVDVFVAYWKTVGEILSAEEALNQGRPEEAEWVKVYDSWKDVVNTLIRGYNTGIPSWTIPCLYVAGKYLRIFAIKADEQALSAKGDFTFNTGFQDDIVSSLGKTEKLEDAARQINRIFSFCNGDRAPIEESRKWGVYYIANLLFKTYFKLKSIALAKNVIRSIHAARDMPDLEAFPKSHIVTFKYYLGVLFFVEEDYEKAEEHLTYAWQYCHKKAQKNLELILTYLIPCRLLTARKLPSTALLAPYPRLQQLFTPLVTCIKRGDLAGFDTALSAGEDEFVKRRIYLTLERGRDIALRNLFRKVYITGGFMPLREGQTEADRVRRTRVPIAEFAAALNLGMRMREGEGLEKDEVECLIANMIYKGYMKGYIARDHGMVVLNKKGESFPGTGV